MFRIKNVMVEVKATLSMNVWSSLNVHSVAKGSRNASFFAAVGGRFASVFACVCWL